MGERLGNESGPTISDGGWSSLPYEQRLKFVSEVQASIEAEDAAEAARWFRPLAPGEEPKDPWEELEKAARELAQQPGFDELFRIGGVKPDPEGGNQ